MTFPRYTEPYYYQKLAACGVPDHMHEGIVMYLLHGLRPGSFYEAVLSNDLRGACLSADDDNKRTLFQHVAFLYNCCPSACWGSPESVEEWIDANKKMREEDAAHAGRQALQITQGE